MISIRTDLMSNKFVSIWLEVKTSHIQTTLVSGFYREWTFEGDNSQECQVKRMLNFVSQIEKAASCNNRILITGDANLCSEKWKSDKYLKKNISTPLLECLVQSGMKFADIGPTFQADHALPDGRVAESSIDHVYFSESMEEEITYKKMATSSSDHLPVIASLKNNITCYGMV